MTRLFLFLLLVQLAGLNNAFAQTSTFVERGVKHTVAWDDMVGSMVEFDGLAWGAFEKGLGEHVVLPNLKIYLKNLDLIESDLNGRLVRIAGVLRKARVEPAPPGAQGYSQAFDYFYVDTVSVARIEKLKLDQLLPSRDDWIVPGLSADAATRLITERNLQAYPLALSAAKDGTSTSSFLISNDLVLVYRVLDGRVVTVSQINLHEAGKLDDEWIGVPGFRLPPITNQVR